MLLLRDLRLRRPLAGRLRLSGVFRPGDPGWDAARSTFNLLIDQHPGLVDHAVWVDTAPVPDGYAMDPGLTAEWYRLEDAWAQEQEGGAMRDLTEQQLETFRERAVPEAAAVLTTAVRLSDDRRHDVASTVVCTEYSAQDYRSYAGQGVPFLAALPHYRRVRKFVKVDEAFTIDLVRLNELQEPDAEALSRVFQQIDELETGHPRHHHIGDNEADLRPIVPPDLQRLRSVTRSQNLIAGRNKYLLHQQQSERVVVDQQDAGGRTLHRGQAHSAGFSSALALVILAGLIHACWNIAAKKIGGDARFALFSCVLLTVVWSPLGVWLSYLLLRPLFAPAEVDPKQLPTLPGGES